MLSSNRYKRDSVSSFLCNCTDEIIEKDDITQKNYLSILDKVNSKLFPNLSLKVGLYNESLYCLKVQKKFFIFTLIKILLRNSIIKCSISGKPLLTFYTKNYRNDHDSYWNKIQQDSGEHDEITIMRESKFRIIFSNPFVFLEKLYWFSVALVELKEIPNFIHRCYLAAQMSCRKKTLERIKKFQLTPKVVMCFFDSSPDECFVMQYFRNLGAITITNQHGQPVFHSFDSDRLNQSQLFNFHCDYFFAKGPFLVEQFHKLGMENKIKIIGVVGYSYNDIQLNVSKVFGVYLDTIGYNFAKKSNVDIINFALNVAQETGYKFFIKIHPSDNESNYYKYLGDHCINIYGSKENLENSFSKADFAIVHCSSTYLDAYLYGIRCFKFQSNIYFPLAYEDDVVSHPNELSCKIKQWQCLDNIKKKEYISFIRNEYSSVFCAGKVKSTIEEILRNQ